jgi:hypothetical protein
MTFGYEAVFEAVLKISLIGAAVLWMHPILDLASFINDSIINSELEFDVGNEGAFLFGCQGR